MHGMELKPTLWRTCRVLANERRLRVLAYVCTAGPAHVTKVAAATQLPQPQATGNLRLLQSRGLLRATRRSRWVEYAAMPDPLVEHAAGMLEAMTQAIRRKDSAAEIMRALTAFTHPRRLRIVMALADAPLLFDQLVLRCSISRPALYRHLRKLERRGLLAAVGEADRYRLVTPPAGVLRDLLRLALHPSC